MQNSGPDADIDFMIITPKHGRLWTTRLILSLYTETAWPPPPPHSSQKFWQTLSQLVSHPHLLCDSESKRSLYTAYELIQAVPAL